MLNEVNAELLGLYLLLITYGGSLNNRRTTLDAESQHRRIPTRFLPMRAHLPAEKSRRQCREQVAPNSDLPYLHHRHLRSSHVI